MHPYDILHCLGWLLLGNQTSPIFSDLAEIFDTLLRKKKVDYGWLRRRLLELKRVDRAYEISIEDTMNYDADKHISCQYIDLE